MYSVANHRISLPWFLNRTLPLPQDDLTTRTAAVLEVARLRQALWESEGQRRELRSGFGLELTTPGE